MGILRKTATGAAWALAAGCMAVPLAQPTGLVRPELALASSALTVVGSVEGLRPGVPAELVLTVENADSRDVVVRRLTAEVSGGGTPSCPSSALSITPWTGQLAVAARGHARQPLAVLLDPTAGCEDVRWELRYTADGVEL
jgi:hypothetical protein